MKRKMNITTRRVIAITLSLVLLAVILLFSIPIPMDRTFNAIEIKLDDPSYLRECTITITGSYHLNLFSDDTFVGSIAVSGYSQTLEAMDTVYLSKEGCPLYYHRYEDGINDEDGRPRRLEYSLGNITSGRFLHKLVIAVYSDNPLDKDVGWREGGSWGVWNERNGYCIVPDVRSYEEAVQTLMTRGVIQQIPVPQYP